MNKTPSSGNLFSFFCRAVRGEGEWVLVVGAYLSLSGKGRGGRLSEAGRLLTFSASRMGANSRLGAYSNKCFL